MIHTRKGDLLDATGLILHGCNAMGQMGMGVAKAIRLKWPAAYQAYRRRFIREGLHVGEVIFVDVAPGIVVANAITQNATAKYPGQVVVDYAGIETACKAVAEVAVARGLTVNFPLIGCGLAGGDWGIVQPIIEKALGPDLDGVLWVL